MPHFGGLGGAWNGRPLDTEDLFEMSVERSLGEAIRGDRQIGVEMWQALSNVDWAHRDGHTAGYSFRAAGDLVAAIRGEGMYMDWYCSGPSGVVSERIAAALASEGWTSKPVEDV